MVVKLRPLTNVNDIIHRWAPPSENNSKSYVDSVCRFSGLHPFERLKFTDRTKMIALVDGMIRVECGEPCLHRPDCKCL